MIERLEAIDDFQRFYRYRMISGIPALDYVGTLDVKANGSGTRSSGTCSFGRMANPPLS